jgi:hypothetical protein
LVRIRSGTWDPTDTRRARRRGRLPFLTTSTA